MDIGSESKKKIADFIGPVMDVFFISSTFAYCIQNTLDKVEMSC